MDILRRISRALRPKRSQPPAEDTASFNAEVLEAPLDSAQQHLLYDNDESLEAVLSDEEFYRQLHDQELEIEAQRREEEEAELELLRKPRVHHGWEDGESLSSLSVEYDIPPADPEKQKAELIAAGWAVCETIPLLVKKELTWASPLPALSDVADDKLILAEGKVCDFLSRFLADRRWKGLPFEESHGLVLLILRSVTACAFDAMQRWAPEDLILLRIDSPDQLELQWWLELLSDMRSRDPKPTEATETNWDLLHRATGWGGIGQARHDAVHRQRYCNTLIVHAVNFLIALNDLDRFREVEKTVKILYGKTSGTFDVTEEELSEMNDALRLYPTECRTPYDLFYTIQGILENMCFRSRQLRDPEWLRRHKVTTAEQVELYGNTTITTDESKLYGPEPHVWNQWGHFDEMILRNDVAHRGGYMAYTHESTDGIQEEVEKLKQVAVKCHDEDAAAQIEQVASAAMVHLQARGAALEAFLRELSAEQLRTMSQQATEKFSKWDPTKYNSDRDIYKHNIAYRFQTASRFFQRLADRKDGTEYRKELRHLRWRADRAHETWQEMQRSRIGAEAV